MIIFLYSLNMKIGILGRTNLLLKTGNYLSKMGYKIGFVWTCKPEKFYNVGYDDFKKFAQKNNSIYLTGLNLKKNIDFLKNANVDLCISCNWLNILPSWFLNYFKFGILNAHMGDLPKYKGNACPNWAILNFEKKIALTIHKMTTELDSGPVLSKKYYKINDDTYIHDIYEWSEKISPGLFEKSIKAIKKKKLIPQDTRIKTLRCFPRKPEDSKLNWNNKTRSVLAIIRASSYPFEGAFCFLNNNIKKKIVIYKAKRFSPKYDFFAIPGQICERKQNTIIVSTKDGMIQLLEFKLNNLSQIRSLAEVTKSMRNRLT